MKCYAAFAKDREIRMKGSSGGLFPVLSKYYIKNGSIVYASVYDDSLNVVFERIDHEADLEKSFTSKYLQSRLNGTFKSVKRDLKNHQQVLFCGTPCQASGLKKYLAAGKVDTANLLIVDFICHGVPSEDVFYRFMREYWKSGCTYLNMRSKETGWDWGQFGWKMSFEDGSEKLLKQTEVPYMRGFLSNLFLRPSCYNCVPKRESSADITLGDFWGISEINKSIPSKEGVSCVILRTENGENAFRKIADEVDYFDACFQDIQAGNMCLTDSVSKPYYRRVFFKKFRTGTDFAAIIAPMHPGKLKNRIINKLYFKMPKQGTAIRDLTDEEHRVIYPRKEQCCGCSACYAICPVDAVSLKKDAEGFFYPIVDNQKCTHCGLCNQVCPFNN